MFKTKSVMLLLSAIIALVVTQCQKKVNLEQENVDVKNAILLHNEAEEGGKFEAVEAVWAHEPYAYRRGPSGSYIAGWDSISAWYKRVIAEETLPTEKTKSDFFNWDIHVFQNMAWAAYNRVLHVGIDSAMFREFRFLEKKNNQWRVMFQQREFRSLPVDLQWPFLEADLNRIGYALLQINKINEAIKVFRMNTEFFPESANVYDSLADAYLATNDKQSAINCIKKSIEKSPKNKFYSERLKKLQ
jgi:tetratricopeptide (TPR) repeat protein